MKAVILSAFGQAPELADVPIPVPAEGEVRVRVHAASVNGFDLAVANGYLNGAMEHRFPVVLGKDFAGTVDAVGAGVEGYETGDRVFGVVTKDYLGDGSFAEYVTVPVAVGLTRIPESVSFTEAAGLGLAGTAAVNAVDAAEISDGHVVLVAGATGGVGNQAVQLALHGGAEVIATAHSDEELAQVRGFGAGSTVDYAEDISAQARALQPEGVDVVLHFAGDPAALVSALKPGGRLVSTLVQAPEQVPAEGVQIVPVYAYPSAETLDRLAQNQAAGRTSLSVQRVFGLEQATDALGQFAAGTLGKLIITID